MAQLGANARAGLPSSRPLPPGELLGRSARAEHVAAGVAAFMLAGALAAELARPFRGGSVAFDGAAAVLYFERLASGRQLEQTLTVVTKPLLTVVYGVLHAIVPDWRVLSWTGILAFALAVALATIATMRIGGRAPAAFVAIGLAGMPALLLDVGLAIGWSLALLLLTIGMLALARTPRRWLLAGIALGLATLIRLELSIVVAGTVGALAGMVLIAWRSGRPTPRGPLWLLVSVAALPVMLLHDWLLTGNPLHWVAIAERYSRGVAIVPSVADVWAAMTGRNAAWPVLVFLAAIGMVALFRSGYRSLSIGLLLLGPGVGGLLLILSARGTFIDTRYTTGMDVGLVVAAAFGVGAVLSAARNVFPRLGGIRGPARRWLALAAGAVAAIACSGAIGAFNPGLRQQVNNVLRLAVDTQAVLPELREFVDRHPSSREFVAESLDGTPLLFVPLRIRPHLVLDLDLPMPEVGSMDGSRIDLRDGYPAVGQLVYHHRRGERRLAGFDVLHITAPRVVDGVRLVPLAVDEDRGYWVIAVEEP